MPLPLIVSYPGDPYLWVFTDFVTAGAASFISPTRGPTSPGSAFCRPRPGFATTWDSKSAPHQARRIAIEAPFRPSQPSGVPRRTVFDFLCRSPKPAISPGSTVSPAGSHSRFVNFSAR